MPVDLNMIFSLAESAALEAGRAIVDHWNDYRSDVRNKGENDIVSAADWASDRVISARICAAFPTHRILSEEDAHTDDYDYSGPLWIIDPLDGTANYVRGHPYFGVSVAFAFDGIVRAGCVHAPALNETFLATRGGGATLNGKPIRVSSPKSLMRSVVSTGFPHERDDFSILTRRVERLLRACQDIRRSASPVLDICYVAMGRLDAHAETLFPWDVAAAGLIAAEAGAMRSNLIPTLANISTDLFGGEVVIAAPEIHGSLVELLEASGMSGEGHVPTF
jgi:myo-inositol-1(or 4)-monophosphatase